MGSGSLVSESIKMKFKCDKHPKYDGHREPNNTCASCLTVYFNVLHFVSGPSAKPTRVIEGEDRYSRKLKHKGKDRRNDD